MNIINGHVRLVKVPHLNISPYHSEYKSFDFWNLLKNYLPQNYNGEKILGVLTEKISLELIPGNMNPSRKFMEPSKYEIFNTEDSISQLTAFIFLKRGKETYTRDMNREAENTVRIYDKKNEGMSLTDSRFDFYNVNMSRNNVLILSNRIVYQFSPWSEDRYILKVPIFFTDSSMK